jgi:hypothetical protein
LVGSRSTTSTTTTTIPFWIAGGPKRQTASRPGLVAYALTWLGRVSRVAAVPAILPRTLNECERGARRPAGHNCSSQRRLTCKEEEKENSSDPMVDSSVEAAASAPARHPHWGARALPPPPEFGHRRRCPVVAMMAPDTLPATRVRREAQFEWTNISL